MKKLLLLTMSMAFMAFTGWAQKTITGSVFDSSGFPLPGATVIEQGTTNGTTTDFDGNFTIQVAEAALIEISYVGLVSQVMAVEGQDQFSITLIEGNELDEVVVTGVAQGTAVRKLGFSIGKVSNDALNTVPAADPANALRGKVAGVRIVQPSGNPSSAPQIRLRGSTSITGSQSPLIIIDGIISNGSLRDIAVEDIETIEVIKGAAASSLYGSLAGNGVLQIITKKGKKNQEARITIKQEVGYSNINGKYPLAQKHPYKSAALATGDWDNDPSTPETSNFGFDLSTGNRVLDEDADGNIYFDNDYGSTFYNNAREIFTEQPFENFTGSISKGGENYNFYASFQQLSQGGILEPIDPYKRQSSRVNLNVDVSDKLSVGFTSNYVKTDGYNIDEQGQGGNFFYAALVVEPFINLNEKDEEGGYYSPVPKGYLVQGSNFENPLYQAGFQTFDFGNERLLTGINADYRVNEFLKFNFSQTLDKNWGRFFYYTPKGYITPTPSQTLNNGQIYDNKSESSAAISSISLNYRRTLGDFNTALTLKYLFENRNYETLNAGGYDLIAEGVMNVENTVVENRSISSQYEKEIAKNYFANIDIDYKDKIIASGLVRLDESSLFGKENRSRVYGRGTLAYILSEDLDFNGIDFMKIRASYGTSGQRPNWSAQYETFSVTTSGISPGRLGNKNLRPSVVAELEAGININFLDNFKFEFNYSKSKTKDDFLVVPLPGVAGFSSQWQNIGEIQSTYYEASLSGDIINTDDLLWSFNLNFDTGNQEITDLGGVPAFTRSGLGTALDVFRVEEGKPYGTMYGFKYATSLDQLTVIDGAVANIGAGGSSAGGGTLSDYSINNYGYVVKTADIGTPAEAPMQVYDEKLKSSAVTSIGNTNPDFNLGFSTSLSYKKLSLYALFDYQQGGDIYNYTKQLLYYNYRHADLDDFGANQKHNSYAENLYNRANSNSHFIEDGTYLKLRELSLGYELDIDLIPGLNQYIDGVRIQLTGRNLITITNYSGWDPEVAIATNPTNFRFDEYSYPNFRTYSAAVTIKF
ncbi:MAG: SusC/RagA family TonB-linked outer membrane protein [Flavobacteriaceae bacterium]